MRDIVPRLQKSSVNYFTMPSDSRWSSFRPISLGALHVYHSALPFIPESQLLRQVYHYELGTAKVVFGLPQCWNPWLFAMHGHSNWVTSVAFSPDGSRIASGSDDQTVRIWDAKTGVHLSTLREPLKFGVVSRILCDGGRPCASGSGEQKLYEYWDVKTSVDLSTLKGHSDFVRSVAFFPDGSCIASEFTVMKRNCTNPGMRRLACTFPRSRAIHIWLVDPGRVLSRRQSHLPRVLLTTHVRSLGMQRLVCPFDAHGPFRFGVVSRVLSRPVAVAFASGSDDKTVRICDAKTGVHLSAAQGPPFALGVVSRVPLPTAVALPRVLLTLVKLYESGMQRLACAPFRHSRAIPIQ